MGKKCNKCKIVKSLSDFYTNKAQASGYCGECKTCSIENHKRYYAKNKEKCAARGAANYQKTKDQRAVKAKEWRRNNAEYVLAARKAYVEKYPERVRETSRRARAKQNIEVRRGYQNAYYARHREKVLAKASAYRKTPHRQQYMAAWMRNRKATDPAFKLMAGMRLMLNRVLRRGLSPKKTQNTEAMLGYTVAELRAHLEKKFTQGMSWANYGEWHIDHKHPLSVMIGEGVTDPAVINALSNLQPLWAQDNMTKRDKVA